MLMAVSTVAAVSAQDSIRQRMTPQQRTELRIKRLNERLALTDEQKTEIRGLYADFQKQKRSKGERKEAMEKLTAGIMAVLTTEQQELYKQLQEEAMAERRKHESKK